VSRDHQIRTLHTRDEMVSLLGVADAVWGPPAGSMVSPDFLMALAHTGGYVAGLFDISQEAEPASMVGCSFGMLGRFRGDLVLHSHITGVLQSLQHRGLGRALKQHQRSWARENDLSAITWTFDPLVRRNGWFNLHCLGATAEEYHVDFYGPLGDAINGTDESDRLLAHWDIASTRAHRAAESALPTSEPQPDDVLVATPEDIVDIRRNDPGAARHWRIAVRERLVDAFGTAHIVGMTHDGAYVVRPRDPRRETRRQ
jgi:predicted GNAT superfamily acetyltransferase